MEKLYQDYKDIAEFYIVYIREAHAIDSRRPVPYAEKLGIYDAKTHKERCSVADILVKEKKLTIPCLIDNLDNKVNEQYSGSPSRVYLIRKDGHLGVAGDRGPWGLRPGIEALGTWLKEFKETGKEPALAKKK
ncbi:MAG: hypothetical protein GY940_39600 [bacterium]|nr:hypothetical protein [bacterium]